MPDLQNSLRMRRTQHVIMATCIINMRFLALFISCFLVFSSVASAAMLCCAETDKTTIAPEAESPPCHPDTDEGAQVTSSDAHECECQGCVQFGDLGDQGTNALYLISPERSFAHDDFLSSEPTIIFHPPKQLS